MIVSAIVAAAENRVIGKDNQIPWYLSKDLQFFKKTTLNHHIVMGRKSFHAIGKPLPKRTNIVVTRDAFFTASGVLVTHSIEEGLQIALDNNEDEAFIIGGGEIYAQSMDLWDRIYYTRVHAEPEGDVFFPELDHRLWDLKREEFFPADEKNDYDFTIQIFQRVADKS